MEPKQKVMIVTGGGRGIGAATAKLAAQHGYAVCVNYLANSMAAELVVNAIEEAGGTAIAQQADVSDEDEVEELFRIVDRELGPLTALVNNAGLAGPINRLEDAESSTIRRVVEVNLLGTIFCARAAVERLSTAKSGQGGGIINISSGAATLGSPGRYVWYDATKGAVDSFTLGLAKEVAGEGIRVNAVAPGVVSTDFHDETGLAQQLDDISGSIPLGRMAEPEEMAQTVLWLLSEQSSYITGTILRAAGGR